MNLKFIIFIALLSCYNYSLGQESISKIPSFLEFIKGKDSLVDSVLKNHEEYRLQIIYGQVTHHSIDSISIINSSLLKEDYYYPASAIKLPCALLALEKLNELNISADHYFRISNDYLCGNSSHIHNSQNSKASFYDIIREMLVVSNNVSYNSVYEFLTPGYIKKKLREKGLYDINIYNKFAACNIPDNLKCNTIKIYDRNDHLLYKQDASVLNLAEMSKYYTFNQNKLIGTYSYRNQKITKTPYDFNYKISASLDDLHSSLIGLIYPTTMDSSHQWNLHESEREFLIKTLGLFPRELEGNKYQDSIAFPDNLYKYIVFGDPRSNSYMNSVRTFGKIGLSFGFATEIAYVVDLVSKNEFFLSIRIYTNKNQTINDGIYQYEETSKAFFGKIGMLLLEYERNRAQTFTPDFSKLEAFYD